MRIPKLEPDAAREKGKQAFQDGKYDKAIKYWQGQELSKAKQSKAKLSKAKQSKAKQSRDCSLFS